MHGTKTQSHNKKASIAAFDLLFSIIIVLSILFPILNFGAYSITSQQQQAYSTQKLSILLQLSEHFYTNIISQKTSRPFSSEVYSHSGILDKNFDAHQVFDYSNMGLDEFSVYTSPPEILSSSQFCIKRKMEPKDIWFCAR